MPLMEVVDGIGFYEDDEPVEECPLGAMPCICTQTKAPIRLTGMLASPIAKLRVPAEAPHCAAAHARLRCSSTPRRPNQMPMRVSAHGGRTPNPGRYVWRNFDQAGASATWRMAKDRDVRPTRRTDNSRFL